MIDFILVQLICDLLKTKKTKTNKSKFHDKNGSFPYAVAGFNKSHNIIIIKMCIYLIFFFSFKPLR